MVVRSRNPKVVEISTEIYELKKLPQYLEPTWNEYELCESINLTINTFELKEMCLVGSNSCPNHFFFLKDIPKMETFDEKKSKIVELLISKEIANVLATDRSALKPGYDIGKDWLETYSLGWNQANPK